MKLISGYMKPEQVWQEVEEIVTLFQRLGIGELTISYGFDCDLDIDDLYQEIDVRTEALQSFLTESISKGIYHLAENDFHIECKPLEIKFLLCHESDVHLETENEEVAEYIRARWSGKQYSGYEWTMEKWVSLPIS